MARPAYYACGGCGISVREVHSWRHASEAVDETRRAEFFREGRAARDLLRGKRWLLLRSWAHLDRTERQTRHLFTLNRRLAKAYLLKEQLGQLWTYTYKGAARRFLAHLIADHRDGGEASRADHYLEYVRLVDHVAANAAVVQAEQLMVRRYAIHFHVWVPEDIRQLIDYLTDALGLRWEILEHLDSTASDEFIYVLRKTDGGRASEQR